MRQLYPFIIAFRYLKSRKRHKSVSFNTITSIGGVALGVMALIIVLSVMSGFHEDLHKKILGANSHIIALSFNGTISDYMNLTEKIGNVPDVDAASPFVLGQVMISNKRNARGVLLRGVIPEMEMRTTDFTKYIKHGDMSSLSEAANGIIIGKELAGNIGIGLNSTVNIISPVGEIGPLGMIPKTKVFHVVAIFEIGMYEYDSSLVITSMKSAQEFFDLGDRATGIEVKVRDVYRAADLKNKIHEELSYPYYLKDWMEMNKNLFSALKLEKLTMFVILTLIILVAAFNIVSTLIMNVMEKEREIAILKTMGAGNRGIMLIFMVQGLMAGLIGTIIGLTCGIAACYILETYQFISLPGDVYYLSHLPVKMNLPDIALVSFSAIVISLLSTIYPSYRAAKLNPIEPLRF